MRNFFNLMATFFRHPIQTLDLWVTGINGYFNRKDPVKYRRILTKIVHHPIYLCICREVLGKYMWDKAVEYKGGEEAFLMSVVDDLCEVQNVVQAG